MVQERHCLQNLPPIATEHVDADQKGSNMHLIVILKLNQPAQTKCISRSLIEIESIIYQHIGLRYLFLRKSYWSLPPGRVASSKYLKVL